ncbi:RHS repeat-associated core domain-containing protein [Pseudoxanthomonas sacheonensis]|uniref:RHS repeat-associated protein n=1 Tax=Pseudoxanthomonas sacheonensis TaxID=443615 RepID=A0ABU1RSQ3_9GAMM|nr:RHS repeat-associated core domain-containing protein [Pseudoxanthomonas sacheonensis]MDR6841144.1 RHS repeat-associated protein [Pseudoxanthomonas sacheonensis]
MSWHRNTCIASGVGLARAARGWLLFGLLLIPGLLCAQTQFPLGGNGWMGLGNRNGDFFIEQDDLEVKVPGGYVRINRDYDGKYWVFNRQWSGLARPSYNQGSYASIGTFLSCTSIDGISSCDNTATASVAAREFLDGIEEARIPNDPLFGRGADGQALSDPYSTEFVARKGVGFSRSSDGTSWVSSDHPRFVVRPMSVPTLPASNGSDAHPAAGKPGAGGVPTTLVNGFRWIDRSGQWIEYDQLGRISSYGDRNNVRVWFQYGSHGQVERVLDDNGRTVLTLLYADDGKFVREVRDHTPVDGSVRNVRYDYDGQGRLRHVVDARGNTTTFEYGGISNEAVEYGGSIYGSTGSSSGDALRMSVDLRNKVTKVIDAAGRATEIGYGVTQRVARIKAPDGGETRFDYAYDKLKKEFSTTVRYPQTDAGQKIETVRFDQEGRPVLREINGKTVMSATGSGRTLTFVDERTGSTTVQRDNFDEITRITYADGSSQSYTYEAGSTDIREFTDEAGTVWRYRWDGRGNLLDVKAAVGKPEEQVTEYIYNGRGEVELTRRKGGTNPDGSTDNDAEVRLTRDDNGNIATLLDGEGKRWEFEYDNLGNVIEVTDPLSKAWTYTYDAHGNVLSETDPNQHAVTYAYDPTGLQSSVTDARGKTTQFSYDAAGRDASIKNPYGNTFLDQYDQAGRLVSRTDASGQSSTLSYDSTGRLISVVDGENYQSLLDYAEGDGVDRGGRQPGKISYPTFQRLMRFDERKRPTQQTDLLADDSLTIGASYDRRGLLRTLTDPNGHTQSTEYDALGRAVAVIDALGGTVRMGYDHRGNLVSVTDEKNQVMRMTYNGRGLLTSETNALGQVTRYVYDDAGNLTEVQRPNGAKIVSQYDPAGRLVQQQGYRATDGALEQTQTFQWDAADNLTGWTSDRASGTLTYDDADRLLSEAVTVDGVTLSRGYTYHPNDQVKTYTGPDGVTLTYSYDGNGQLERIDIPGEGSISATEWNWLAPKKIVLPGGTVQEMDRDGLMGLTRLRVKSPGQAVLFELENRFGKLRELTERSADGKATRYEYDEAVRLVEADPAFAGGTSETYVIDAAGNREQHSLVSGTWEYDAANRLQRRGQVSYDYDGAGNLIRKVDANLAEPVRTTRYAYDAFNRLVEVRDGADAVVATYAYDPFDQRLAKEVLVARNGTAIGKTLYLHGEEGLLAEVDASGSVMRSYGWHPEGEYATAPLFQHTGAGYFYYHNDHLGTPWRVTNRDGVVVWSASDYTAFGTAKVAAGAQIVQPWRFPGQYLDLETALHYNLRRYYEPDSGRYVTEDPLRLESSSNFYAYVGHSPTNNIDPTGEILPAAGAAARWAFWRYSTCLLECAAVDAAIDLIRNPCNIDVSDCLKECLWSLVPIKVPCKFRGMLGSLAGAAAGMLNSFTADTEVATPEGLKRIADLRPGDKVLAYAEWKDETQIEEVTDLILSHHEQTIVTLTLASGEKLEVTGGHPLHTPTGWRAAQLLQAGGQLDIKGPDGNLRPVGIDEVELRQETIPVYNLEISNAHTFFVGADGVLAHNAVHHVCTNKNKKYSDKFRDLFEKNGLGKFKNGNSRKDVLNDPLNRLDLPGHQGPHNPEMNQQTLDRLRDADRNGPGAFRDELERIRQETATPGTPMHDSATGNWR